MLSLVIPVYKNQANLDRLLDELIRLADQVPDELEVVFVVDGSPDGCLEILRSRLPSVPLRSLLISLSRNFGSFSAIKAGLERGGGEYLAVLAADLQEPPDLILQFFEVLRKGEADIVFGCRAKRSDPWVATVFSNLFWVLFRKFVIPDIPKGGVDVFGCTREVRDCILQFREANTNLIALLFWIGFRRHFIAYERAPRLEGKGNWTFRKRLQYCADSIFNFTDLPIQLLLYVGAFGTFTATTVSIVVLVSKLVGNIRVPGYTALVLTIIFFGGLTSLGLGIIGQYLWLTLLNARRRPNYIISSVQETKLSPGREHPRGPATEPSSEGRR